MKIKREYLPFLLIVVFNLLLKGLNAGSAPYGFDEIISVKDTLLEFGHIKHESEWDNNPPFFYYCFWIWHKFIPINELNSRILPVIFISFSIGLAYLISVRYFDLRIAIFSSVLLTLSNFLTYYSQEARVYALVVLLALISSIQFLKYQQKSSEINLILLAVTNFLLIYSHYIAGILIVLQYVIIFIYHRKDRKYFIFHTSIIVALVLLRFTKKQFANILGFNHNKDFWLSTASNTDLTYAFSNLYFGPIISIIFFLVFILVLIRLLIRNEERSAIMSYFILVGFGSILMLFIVGQVQPVFLDRYLIFSIPFGTIIVVNHLLRYKTIGFVIVIVLIFIQFLQLNVVKETKMDFASIVKVIDANLGANDKIIINKRDNILLYEFYHNRTNFLKYKNIDSICKVDQVYGVNVLDDISNIPFKENSIVYLVQAFHKLHSSENRLKSNFDQKIYNIYQNDSYGGVELNIYRFRPARKIINLMEF